MFIAFCFLLHKDKTSNRNKQIKYKIFFKKYFKIYFIISKQLLIFVVLFNYSLKRKSMKKETLNGTLTVQCDAITATVVQDVDAKKGFYFEITHPETDEILERESQPSMMKVYERINTFNRWYRENGFKG